MKRQLLLLGTLLAAIAAVAIPFASAKPAAQATASIAIAVKSDTEHGKLGPDGKWHDAFLPASFSVKSGAKVTVTITNYDSGAHSFDASALGLNVRIPAGSLTHPTRTTFTFTAPKSGNYMWSCIAVCDAWAMTHMGYMMGNVHVTA